MIPGSFDYHSNFIPLSKLSCPRHRGCNFLNGSHEKVKRETKKIKKQTRTLVNVHSAPTPTFEIVKVHKTTNPEFPYGNFFHDATTPTFQMKVLSGKKMGKGIAVEKLYSIRQNTGFWLSYTSNKRASQTHSIMMDPPRSVTGKTCALVSLMSFKSMYLSSFISFCTVLSISHRDEEKC